MIVAIVGLTLVAPWFPVRFLVPLCVLVVLVGLVLTRLRRFSEARGSGPFALWSSADVGSVVSAVALGVVVAVVILAAGPTTRIPISSASYPNTVFCGHRGIYDERFFGVCGVPSRGSWHSVILIEVVLAFACTTWIAARHRTRDRVNSR